MTKRPGIDLKKVEAFHPIFVAPLAINLILLSHAEISAWPTIFVKVSHNPFLELNSTFSSVSKKCIIFYSSH